MVMVPEALSSRLHELAGSALSSLRVVALTYAGLGGVIALALLVSVAVLPVAPVLQQATEPARQIVSGLTQTSPGGMGSFISGGPGFRLQTPKAAPTELPIGPVVVFGPSATGQGATPDRDQSQNVADPEVDEEPAPEVEAPVEVVPVRAYVPRVMAPARVVEATVADEPEEEADEVEPIVAISLPPPTEIAIVQPVEHEVLQAASEAPPRALPPLPTPTDTPQQAKAHADLQNQAAIDAARAAQVRARATADAANQAAIDDMQAGDASSALARNRANGANQAGIDATRVARHAPPVPDATATPRPT
jgi:hypothetical protein